MPILSVDINKYGIYVVVQLYSVICQCCRKTVLSADCEFYENL